MKSGNLKKMISLKTCDECWLEKELKTEGLPSIMEFYAFNSVTETTCISLANDWPMWQVTS